MTNLMGGQEPPPPPPLWLAAIAGSGINPQPCNVNCSFDYVELSKDGNKVPAIVLTVVDVTGVKTVFLAPQGVAALLESGAQILAQIAQEQAGGLIVANPQQMKDVAAAEAKVQNLRQR